MNFGELVAALKAAPQNALIAAATPSGLLLLTGDSHQYAGTRTGIALDFTIDADGFDWPKALPVGLFLQVLPRTSFLLRKRATVWLAPSPDIATGIRVTGVEVLQVSAEHPGFVTLLTEVSA